MADFIDITPKTIGGKKKEAFVFQESEWNQILNNPGRLTKEGVQEKIRVWKRSNNGYVVLKYQTMLVRCKDFSPSGKTKEGLVIFSRTKDGAAAWVEEPKE